jgi:hypothetical protein
LQRGELDVTESSISPVLANEKLTISCHCNRRVKAANTLNTRLVCRVCFKWGLGNAEYDSKTDRAHYEAICLFIAFNTILVTVGLCVIATGAVSVGTSIMEERKAIERSGEQRANAALNMLESVHTNAMTYRKRTADGDAAIATLNGTMEQFSGSSADVKLWMVMGPKVLAYQKSKNADELEGPKDKIDQKAISTAQRQSALVGDSFRQVRPVILPCPAAALAQNRLESINFITLRRAA